jgi:protein-tyrosine-phosphatase
MREYDQEADGPDVPDPYYDGRFDRVYAILDKACRGLLEALRP